MCSLKTFSNIEQIKEFFVPSYIEDRASLIKFLDSKQGNSVPLYRGVESPAFKMYNSAQRFYINNQSSLDGLSYNEFITVLYECSKTIKDSCLSKLYDNKKQDNIVQFENSCAVVEYNQLWAFSALQHFSMCAPCIDFSINPYVALFFASEKLMTSDVDNSSTDAQRHGNLDDYISIISFEETINLLNTINLHGGNLYGSYVEYLLDARGVSRNLSNAVDAIQNADFIALPNGQVRYVTYGSKSTPIIGRTINYTINIENTNIVPQEGRLFVMNSQNETFEEVWKSAFAFNENPPELKMTLISKTLRGDIQEILAEKGYSREKLVITLIDCEKEIMAKCREAINRKV